MDSKTYQNIYKELLNCISCEDTLTDMSMKFKTLTTDAERVADCYSMLAFYNLLPESNVTKKKKSSEVAEKLKNNGNRAFIYKDDNLALYYYNRAIGYAPVGSQLFSLVLGNRSAVTFSLEDYPDCIKDIDRALFGNYPSHLKYKLLERKGKALMKIENFIEAKTTLQEAVDYLPQSNVDSNKLQSLRDQLNLLIGNCLAHPASNKTAATDSFFQLTHGANPAIPSGSNAIDIDYSPTMGRFIVATTDINPGDILAVEKPYSSISLPSSYFSHCFYCQKRCHSMIPCLECTMVSYCDEVCRENSWKESHSIECSVLPLLLPNCGKMELLALRVLVNSTKKGKLLPSIASSRRDLESFTDPKKKGFVGDTYLSESYKAIHNLEGNTEHRCVSYLFYRSVIASCILHNLDVHTNFFDNCSGDVDSNALSDLLELEGRYGLSWEKICAGGLLLKYLQSMGSNAHEISEMRLIPGSEGGRGLSAEIGSAAYPLLSLINHSCDPNVVRHSHSGSTVVLTAIQIIRKGHQIFDNYGFHHATHSREERHSHLSAQYYFTCECAACSENWPLYRDLPERNPTYLHLRDPKLAADSSKRYKEILEELTQEKCIEVTPEAKLMKWLGFLYKHLALLQESIKRPWQEFSACQEVIKQCLSFLANHHVYMSSPQSLMDIIDKETREHPF